MAMPETKGKYLVLYRNSGRRSIWGEWEYLEWRGRELVSKANWRDESPYNQDEPPFVEATLSGRGRESVYKITDGETDAETELPFVITKGGKPFAKVTVLWPRSRAGLLEKDPHNMALAWLFERITTLPRDYYPAEKAKKPDRLELHAATRVEGTKEALQMFKAARRTLNPMGPPSVRSR
jgi:hypothetical protein